MEENVANAIAYYLVIDEVDKEDLSPLRKWANLKVGFDKNEIWISNFDRSQIESVRVKQIPHKIIYYSKLGKLYLLNSLLPTRNELSLLWTPIERAFPLELGELNHNYFGIEEEIEIKLIQDENAKKGEALLTTIENLKTYIDTASEYRLKKIEWVILNNTHALLFGTPLLPIDGQVFWKTANSFLPVGYNFELELLASFIEESIEATNEDWILWNKNATYFKVNKENIRPLSISSARRSINTMKKEAITAL